MATIIEFRGGGGRYPRASGPEGAEVIIFPGVRRERPPEHTDETKSRKRERARVKRDRIELPE